MHYMVYELTMDNGSKCDVSAMRFHETVKRQGKKVGHNFVERCAQLQEYIGYQHGIVTDWEMIEQQGIESL